MKKLTAILLTGAIAASLSACSTQAEEPASLGMDLSQYTVVDIFKKPICRRTPLSSSPSLTSSAVSA